MTETEITLESPEEHWQKYCDIMRPVNKYYENIGIERMKRIYDPSRTKCFHAAFDNGMEAIISFHSLDHNENGCRVLHMGASGFQTEDDILDTVGGWCIDKFIESKMFTVMIISPIAELYNDDIFGSAIKKMMIDGRVACPKKYEGYGITFERRSTATLNKVILEIPNVE